jgi:hypothetical protein
MTRREAARHNQRVLQAMRAERMAEANSPAARQQASIDHVMEGRLRDARAEREFRQALDPFNMGLYGPTED